ncbi:LOW QUALITY PROTEIN: uncharacterized protein [Amphiura filiformis]|uniref:LOW QUALITY PROTEIN: uncharacterized protein n=1 Tax=Amphiura filiformis TaxID=82378 RepID=UPI003B218395
MTANKVFGHWLEGSGWVEALQEAEIATPGIAESFLKASHVTRARHAHQQAQRSNKAGSKVILLQSESALFSRQYIACQTRDGDLDNFFSHENHPFPPSLSSYGQHHLPLQKSHLMHCLEQYVETTYNARPRTDVSIMDGAVLVSILKPVRCKVFGDYTTKVFVPYIQREQNQAQRLDIVWDQYFGNSLKSQTREKRSTGPTQGRCVELTRQSCSNSSTVILSQVQLQKSLSLLPMATLHSARPLSRDMTNLAPCNHEEADSRIMVHVADAIMLGFQRTLVRTVDTDIVVLAVTALPQLGRAELCIEQISEETGASLEYFTILLYDRTAICTYSNETKALSSLPPTRAAIQQHIRRAVLQCGHIWASTTVPYRQMPSPADWGCTCLEQ